MWEFVINLLEVAILFLLFNTKLEKKELSYSLIILQYNFLLKKQEPYNMLLISIMLVSSIFIMTYYLRSCTKEGA